MGEQKIRAYQYLVHRVVLEIRMMTGITTWKYKFLNPIYLYSVWKKNKQIFYLTDSKHNLSDFLSRGKMNDFDEDLFWETIRYNHKKYPNGLDLEQTFIRELQMNTIERT